jgi:hypothetical protein
MTATALIALIVFLIGLIPALISLLMMRKAEAQARERLRRAVNGSAAYGLRRFQYSLSPDHHYVEGVGYLIGDLSCQFNARSPHMRCAVNPLGPCQGCSSYEAVQFPEEPTQGRRDRPIRSSRP